MDLVTRFLLCALPPALLALLALWKKALTRGGLALAWFYALVISFCGTFLYGGAWTFWILAITFLGAVLAGAISGRTGKRIGETLHAKHGPRDARQIVCNVLVGTVALLIGALSGHPCWAWAYCGAMAASLADSMASELGVLSKRPPRDILTGKPVAPGMSGGVTLLGLGASLLGALLIAVPAALGTGSWAALPAVAGSGFVAALCDSVLGSAFQKKYRCPVCGAVTEKTVHCAVPGVREKGFLDNDGVNFCNNLIGAVCAVGAYFIFM